MSREASRNSDDNVCWLGVASDSQFILLSDEAEPGSLDTATPPGDKRIREEAFNTGAYDVSSLSVVHELSSDWVVSGTIRGEVPNDFSTIFRQCLTAAGHDPDRVRVGRQLKESHWQQRSAVRDEEGRQTGEYETVWLHAFKFETFNLFNNEEKIAVNNTSWCNATTAGTCTTARNNFGTATSRESFVLPRTFRFTFLVRF